MVNYQLGKIYKLYCVSDESLFYIGSTAQKTLADRLKGHVRNYKVYLNGKHNYMSSFKVIETGNYKIELLESYPCKNKDELRAREGKHIRKHKKCCNIRVEGRTRKEYWEDNKEHISKKNKERYETNRIDRLQKQREYIDMNRTEINLKKKEHYKKNSERLKAQSKLYRERNKVRIVCGCGNSYLKYDRSKHFKSKKHQAWVDSQQKNN